MAKRAVIEAKQTSVIPITHDVFTVVKEGNLDVLERMLAQQDFNVNVTRWSGFSLLHRAAIEGQTDVCDMLLKAGARVNQRTVWGWYTPLHLALANGYEDTAKFLIEQGANVRAKSKDKEDCCDYAQRRGFKELAASFRLRLARYEMVQLAEERMKRIAKNKLMNDQMELEAAHAEASKRTVSMSAKTTITEDSELRALDESLTQLQQHRPK